MLSEGKKCLNSLVGIGSKIKVDGLDEAKIVHSSENAMGQKRSKDKSFSTEISLAAVLDVTTVIIVGRKGMSRNTFSL